MRVLQVINSLILAGAEMLVRDLAPRLQARGVEITLAVLKTLDSPLEHELRAAGYRFLPIESSIYNPEHMWKLARYVGEFDVVHTHLFPAQLWAAGAVALAGGATPLVSTEPSTSNNRRKAWFRPLDRWMYRRYAFIACNSQATRDSLAAWVPGVRDRLAVIYNGIPLERFQAAAPARREEVLPGREKQKIVIFVARFDRAKDHATLLRAVARLSGVDLLLVGDGDSRPQAEELGRKLGIAGRVHFLGRRHDIPQLLKMSDLNVQSSVFEGFGIAAAEAMSAGLPVIASDVPGLNEIVRGAGLLFPAGDDAALANHMASVLGSPARREQLAAASLRRAPEFSIERTADAWIEAYEGVARDRKRPTTAAYAD